MRLRQAGRIAQHRLPSSLVCCPSSSARASKASPKRDTIMRAVGLSPDCHAATRHLLSRGEVRHCDDHPVGRDDLLPDLLIAPDLNLRIDGGQSDDHQRHVELVPQHRVSCQREHDRYRVSESARLDDHLAHLTHAAVLLVQQVAQRADQFLATAAADAAALQQID